MRLYHGTIETVGRAALVNGLRSRSNHKGKWNWDFAGHRHVVYLTDAYPIVYANAAVQRANKPERMAIIEVDVDRLDPDKMVPDEDVLAMTLGRDEMPNVDIKARAIHYSRLLLDHADKWESSLRLLGTCGHYGNIPSTAICRVAVIDPAIAKEPVSMALDAIIGQQNYRLVGPGHRAITQWFFGDPPQNKMNDLQRFLVDSWLKRLESMERHGVELLVQPVTSHPEQAP